VARQSDFTGIKEETWSYAMIGKGVRQEVELPIQMRHAADSDTSPQPSLTTAQLHELLGAIYQGCMESLPWSDALIHLRRILAANWATLILRPASDTRKALIVNSGPNGAFMETGKYATHSAFMLDPFNNLPPGRIKDVDEVLGVRQWLDSEFYRQFLEPVDIRYMIGADMMTPDGAECRLRICRPPSAEAFSAEDKAWCETLLPHFKRAVHLHSRLERIESERALYSTTIDRMLLGTIVFDESGSIIRVNHPAEDILAQSDGLRICGGHLEASYARENAKLQMLIRRALTDTSDCMSAMGQAMSITRPSGRGKLGIAVRANPSKWSEGPQRVAVTVFIRDPEQKSMAASRELIQQLFEFTPSEASVAILLADGMTLDEAADKLGIRKNTARAHLRSIFSKTGVKRQTSLVRLLLGSVS